MKKYKIFFIIVFCLSVNSGFGIDTDKIKELREKGYSDTEIRTYIKKNKNKTEKNNTKKIVKAETLRKIKNRIRMLTPIGGIVGNYRIYKSKLNINNKCFSQSIERYHSVETNYEIESKYRLPFAAIEKMEVESFQVTEGLAPGALGAFFNRERLAYRIVVTTHKLKKFILYLNEPYCYDRHEAKIVLDKLKSLS